MANNYDKMKATVKGRTEEGENFVTPIEFKILRPDEKKEYYGNGCYMRVKLPHESKLIDIRYLGVTDIEILADRWIKSWFGDNAEEVEKQFER